MIRPKARKRKGESLLDNMLNRYTNDIYNVAGDVGEDDMQRAKDALRQTVIDEVLREASLNYREEQRRIERDLRRKSRLIKTGTIIVEAILLTICSGILVNQISPTPGMNIQNYIAISISVLGIISAVVLDFIYGIGAWVRKNDT